MGVLTLGDLGKCEHIRGTTVFENDYGIGSWRTRIAVSVRTLRMVVPNSAQIAEVGFVN